MAIKNLPSLSARQVIKALKELGFYEERQKGSHLVLFNPTSKKKNCGSCSCGQNDQKNAFEINH